MKNQNSQQQTVACKAKLEAINDLSVLEQCRLYDLTHELHKAYYGRFPYEPNDPYRNFWNSDEEMTAQAKMNEVEDNIDKAAFRIQKAVDAANKTQDPTGVWDNIMMEMDNIIGQVYKMIDNLKK